jgi:RimJ/RimL family protein N-acetyltransferase
MARTTSLDDLPRITLRPVDEVRARAILDRTPCADDVWISGYPAEGDIEAAVMTLKSLPSIDQTPFASYEIVDELGRTVGGAGFHGPPDQGGVVEIGYGIAPSVRNRGFAKSAIKELIAIAVSQGASLIVARTDPENRPSRRALEWSGFVFDRVDDRYAHHSLACCASDLRRASTDE